MASVFEKLISRLDLEEIEPDVYAGGAGIGGVTVDNRLFGGLVVAQATVAAARSTERLTMHSMHAYFLRPGRPDKPIRYAVERIKEGRNFHARQVRALQGNDLIFQMMASFSHNRPDLEHQDPMIHTPRPETLPNRDQLRGNKKWADAPIDVRLCDPLTSDQPLPPTKSVWFRAQGPIPDDPHLNLAVFVYATDRAFLSTAWRPHADKGMSKGASLDHSLWFHEQVNFNDWHLFQMHSPILRYERGLVRGGIYRQDGRRVASVAQEGLMARADA